LTEWHGTADEKERYDYLDGQHTAGVITDKELQELRGLDVAKHVAHRALLGHLTAPAEVSRESALAVLADFGMRSCSHLGLTPKLGTAQLAVMAWVAANPNLFNLEGLNGRRT
jgi:hypothetical protein